METKQTRFVHVILIIIKFCELLFGMSLTILNSLRSYIKHLKEFTKHWLKKAQLCLVFSTHLSVFGYQMKHSHSFLIYSHSFLIYYIKISLHHILCILCTSQFTENTFTIRLSFQFTFFPKLAYRFD